MGKIIMSGLLVFLFSFSGLSQNIVGQWKTIDDETGKPKSIVEIYLKDGKAYGKIVKLFREKGEDLDPTCTKCTDDDPYKRKNQKIIGMVIITGLIKDGNDWSEDDAILDPNNGELYDCKLWVDESNAKILNVRGYIGFFFRTQTWHRVE